MTRQVLGYLLVAGAAGVALAAKGEPGAEPVMPGQICSASSAALDAQPDYGSLLADGRLDVAALFGQMDNRWSGEDHGTWSYNQFVLGLQALGLEQGAGTEEHWLRFEGRLDVGLRLRVDVLGPHALPRDAGGHLVNAALENAVQTHEFVYLNGHSFGGALHSIGEASTYAERDYSLLVLDTCWSTQHYASKALQAASTKTALDLIVNDGQSVTGSVHGFLALLDDMAAGVRMQRRGVPAQSWAILLERMNQSAGQRARERLAIEATTAFRIPERYRLGALCEPVSPGAKLAL